MQKNWYIVYTKTNCEKKVALLFSKKRIENFSPLNCITTRSVRRNKFLYEPLFKSYVFVKIAESDISPLRQTDGVINFLYWMGKPAIIREDEMDVIREFTTDHQNIELERAKVNPENSVRIIDGPSYSIDGNVFALKNTTMKVYLPSLGFIMVAKMQDESIFAKKPLLLPKISISH